MPFSPSIVPSGEDQDVYLLLDQFGERLGRAWRETDEDDTDFEMLIRHLLEGQYSNPVRVVASTPRKVGPATYPTTWPTSSESAAPSTERCPPSSSNSLNAMIPAGQSNCCCRSRRCREKFAILTFVEACSMPTVTVALLLM